MGLDITAYSHLREVECDHEGVWCYKETRGGDRAHISACAYSDFPQSYRGLAKADRIVTLASSKLIGGACYEETQKTETHKFSAGSYSGYGMWRTDLGQFTGFASLEDIWENPETYKDLAFFEILNFADNEGSIGPEAAQDLYEDFCTFESQYRIHADDWQMRTYLNFKQACDLARESGMVRFH